MRSECRCENSSPVRGGAGRPREWRSSKISRAGTGEDFLDSVFFPCSVPSALTRDRLARTFVGPLLPLASRSTPGRSYPPRRHVLGAVPLAAAEDEHRGGQLFRGSLQGTAGIGEEGQRETGVGRERRRPVRPIRPRARANDRARHLTLAGALPSPARTNPRARPSRLSPRNTAGTVLTSCVSPFPLSQLPRHLPRRTKTKPRTDSRVCAPPSSRRTPSRRPPRAPSRSPARSPASSSPTKGRSRSRSRSRRLRSPPPCGARGSPGTKRRRRKTRKRKKR